MNKSMNSIEVDINLKALKKVDPYIVSIEAKSISVALYKFSSGKGDWDKTEVEGTLFVYKREADPEFGFTIMNRLNMDNLVEPVTKDLDFQIQPPFLLYRNHASEIFGIWFYEQAECEAVGKKIEELVKIVADKIEQKKKVTNGAKSGGKLEQLFKSATAEEQVKPSAPVPAPAPTSNEQNDTGKNLLRLLSQNETGGGQDNNNDKTNASVQDFFAKAVSSGDTGSAFTSVPTMFTQPPLPITVMPISQGLAHGMVPVGGYHLLGQPPVPAPAPAGGSDNPGVAGINPVVQKLMSNPGVHSVDAIEAEQRMSASPPTIEQVESPPKTKKLSDLESDLKKKLHIGSSSFLDNNNDHTFAPVQTDTDTRESSVKLLSPHSFSRPTVSPSPPAAQSTHGHAHVPVNGVSPPAGQLTPLTQEQLVEAMNFLLENDTEFVRKIHQAYIMSLNRKLTLLK